MGYNKTGDWENTCNRADALSPNKKDPEKVADVFSRFFFQLLKI
jgi:hypothetical protein